MDDKQKILIVDDNPTNIRFVADSLKELPLSLIFVTNGFKALEIVKREDLDLILMDINMPKMDGFDTVKKMETDIPVIYVTALDDKTSVLKAFESGGVDYITKPFYPQELVARVTTHLRLAKLNKDLKKEVKNEIIKRKEKERILMHQSKLASMGEMIDAIAHQWKQPINLINLRIELLSNSFEEGTLDKNYMEKFKEKIGININHMTTTLNEFRTFFRPNKNVEIFSVKKMIEKVLLLIKDEFLNHKVKININEIEDFSITGVENEFKHLILNIINNAKDAFNENNIPLNERIIDINISCDGKKNYIEIIDNAGGIPGNILPNIFKSDTTTKINGKGTGIGLYLSSQIAKKYNGTLKAQNIPFGAKFTYIQKKER